MSPLFIALITASICWVAWRATRTLFVQSPLDNIPGPESPSYLRGNLRQFYDRHGWDFLDRLGTRYNSVVRITGILGHRILYVFDPLALQQITLREMESYEKPEWNVDAIHMTLGPGLFGVQGETHRKQRKMLNPVFSVNHMRAMTPLFYTVAHKLCAGIETQLADEKAATVNMLDWLGRTALELMGQGGLGCSLDNLERPVPNAFGDAIRELLPAVSDFSELQFLFKYVKRLGPAWLRNAVADIVPLSKINHLRRVALKIESESTKILADKIALLGSGDDNAVHQVGEGKDIMSILLRANMSASPAESLSEEELIAQMSTLVAAGTDSTSGALCAMLDMFAHNPDVQDKLRAELAEAQERYGEDIPHDELVALPYMDAFCRETMRIYPPVSFMVREAKRDITMPVAKPVIGLDGTPMNEIPVPAGTTIFIGIRSGNLSKDIWGEDALEFKPERWLSSLPPTVTEAHIPGVYSNLMTFHGGGRSCIGFKFSQLEMKVVLSVLIPKFRVSLAQETKEVVWNLSGLRYPTVGRESTKPAFPVRMECITS
ncbi:hypothetical protein QCA50_005200 [Cerrena zonata]|uniref:Cytochrome P450 n=1 Tax=Cerrena zonata TaxID=2478898 RepID=A0AAW0GPG7_9APHY